MRICGIVVTYQPNLTLFREILKILVEQVQQVVIIDNGSERGKRLWLQKQAQTSDVLLIELGDNAGLAAAQNKGIMWAMQNHFTHVLLLDQDSRPAPSMVSRLVTALNELTEGSDNIAAVGPTYTDRRLGAEGYFVKFGWWRIRRIWCNKDMKGEIVAADFLISSGLLIPLAAINAIGFMDEGLFVDHVDTEWFLRARAKGFKAYGVCQAKLEHRLGDSQRKLWLGRWRFLPVYRPERYYYIFRNSILIYRRRYTVYRWVISDVIKLVGRFLIYSTLIPPRLENLKCMTRGIRDGIARKTGRADFSRNSVDP